MRARLSPEPQPPSAVSRPERRAGSKGGPWAALGLVTLAAALWELAARANWVSPLFFPAPSVIAEALARLATAGRLPADAAATLVRAAEGVVAGCAPACVLGLAMGASPRLRAVFDPLIAASHPLPKIALLPLLMVVFGIGELSKVMAVALAAFFPMLLSAMAGVRSINPLLFEVVESYGATRRKVFTRVVLPGSLPMLLTGLRISGNVALVTTIAVELVAAERGLGVLIWFSWETMRSEELYAGLFVIALIGIAFNASLGWLALRLVPWQLERRS